jgi:hypothetical protein
MKTNYIIIDDIYDNPWEIRQRALELEYKKLEGSTYPGLNSLGFLYNNEMHKNIEGILNTKLENPRDMQAGYFRISHEDADAAQDIHIDPDFDYGGVLFLNPPNQCTNNAGTSFYTHKILGIDKGPKNLEEVKQLGFPGYENFVNEMIYGDCLDRSKWERYCRIPYKFNRLVLFDSHLWHSHGVNFGNNLQNSRLVQLFFYKRLKNDTSI